MDNRLERGEFVAVAEHARAEFLSIDAVRSGGAGKARLDRSDQGAAGPLQPVYLGVGIEHGDAFALKHRRGGRLAHANRAGEAEDEGAAKPRAGARAVRHAVSSPRNSSSRPSGGEAPKNSSKASAAWPISMSSPSTTPSPRASAAARSPVCSGE